MFFHSIIADICFSTAGLINALIGIPACSAGIAILP